MQCRLKEQGIKPGKCITCMPDGSKRPACEATLRKVGDEWSRVITSAHLSRPEHYYSIYMSGCCMDCLKCHSAAFTKNFKGQWCTTSEIAELCADYAGNVTVDVPLEEALDWYAAEMCKSCGSCVLTGERGSNCPGKSEVDQITWSPQGWGPARNIVGYTGGDLGCCSEFYSQLTEEIKARCRNMWVLFETNGYGLTRQNLELLRNAGVDSFWLDIKAYDDDVHKRLCGVDNERILELPGRMLEMGFQVEVLSLYIPGWVEQDQLCKIAKLLVDVDRKIPFSRVEAWRLGALC